MKRFNYKLFVTLVIIIVALNIFSEISQQPDQTLFNGTIKIIGEETYLNTGEDFYQLNLAPSDFLVKQNVNIENKQDISLKGVLDGEVIIVFSLIFDEQVIDLRNASGKPKWDSEDTDSNSYVVNPDKCIGCRMCVSKCPTNAITMVKGVAVIDADKCIACGICANGDNKRFKGCPVKAISQP